MEKQQALTQQEFYKLFILKELQRFDQSVSDMYESLHREFPHKPHSRNHFFVSASKLKDNHEIVLAYQEGRNKVYTVTTKGKQLYDSYIKQFKDRFLALKKVADRFVYEISGTGKAVPVGEVSDEDRNFFSTLVSVKDVVRYVLLKQAMNQPVIVISETQEYIKDRFGWSSSKAFIYNIAHEMEEDETGPLILGRWGSERRFKREYRIQPRGNEVFKQIADAAETNVRQAQHFLGDALKLFES
ncbi:hypothetical protein [Desertibacillus haloalkaliphilus]|uniref:hypothetical protein n=1 Tax=Desertibacillus haloalkaliphilus TaxID=1328930 RepID=UPI001C26E8CC|nr:hypothetical protein [Desertibacillus haloalkaliphilus]MBU8908140.1 hypothetical protein [Desertibacillus haloalkaliphilus]